MSVRETKWDRGGWRETERAASPGSAILTICESLEAHLTAVFAKASHSPCPHLYHIDSTRPEALHACCVCLASQNGGVNLSMVLKGAVNTGGHVRDDLQNHVRGKVLNHKVKKTRSSLRWRHETGLSSIISSGNSTGKISLGCILQSSYIRNTGNVQVHFW